MFLQQELSELQKYSMLHDKIVTTVSQVSVGRHIAHSLIVIRDVMQEVLDSDPKDYRWTVNIGRWIVLTTGFIPRGRAKAPDFTIPKDHITVQSLMKTMSEVKSLLSSFELLTNNHKHFKHPFFGILTLAESKKNLIIHTNHHLKIISDIVR